MMEKEKFKFISTRMMMISLDEQKMCCHHNLKDLQFYTDGAWSRQR